MNSEGNELLAVAQEFEFLVRAPVWGNESPRDLFERRVCAEGHCPLWRLPDPDQDVSAFLEPLSRERLDCFGRCRVENIGVEDRDVPGKETGALAVGIQLIPKGDLVTEIFCDQLSIGGALPLLQIGNGS
jgi:hypothetical protein